MFDSWEDFQSAIVYPLGSLLLFMLTWKCLVSRLSCCLFGLPDKTINAAIISMVHVSALKRMSPHHGDWLPTPPHVEVALLFCSSHYFRTAFSTNYKTEIAFNLMVTVSILDIVTLQQGGDLAIYYLFLLEAPDFLSLYLTPFLRSEACFEFIYTLIYIVFRIFLLAHITALVILNKQVSEDVKMNLSILFLFSFACFPAMLVSCYQACAGSIASFISNLPRISRCRKKMIPGQVAPAPRRRRPSRPRAQMFL